jgi:hypothetical protein
MLQLADMAVRAGAVSLAHCQWWQGSRCSCCVASVAARLFTQMLRLSALRVARGIGTRVGDKPSNLVVALMYTHVLHRMHLMGLSMTWARWTVFWPGLVVGQIVQAEAVRPSL